jgi:hypothetical protein
MWERPAADPGRSPKLCPHLEPAAQLIEVHIYTEVTMDPTQNQTEGEMRKVPLGCCLTAMVAVPVIGQQASKILRFDGTGTKRLNSETREWGRQVTAIARILEAS